MGASGRTGKHGIALCRRRPVRRRYDEAALWAVRAAARPNAHIHIFAIAAHCLAVAGRVDEARSFAAGIYKTVPGYSV
jgi:hypothetical protein